MLYEAPAKQLYSQSQTLTIWPCFCVAQVQPVGKMDLLLKLYEVMLMYQTYLP